MKFLLKIIFTSATAYLMQLYMPWWSVVVASFLISLILSSKGLSSFFSGFLGIGILWFFLAWRIDSATGSILTEKVANLFSLPNSILLILVTALIGGLAGGFGALAGSHLRSVFTKDRAYSSKYIS
jgi:cell division protein FtsX